MNSPTDLQLNRRCALFTLLAMSAAIAMGLVAWGPILLGATAHTYADTRSFGGWAQGANALACLPMLLAGVWGWRALRRSSCPASLRTPWRLGFASIALAGGLSTAYHLGPSDLGYVAAQSAGAGAFVLLLCGFLAERVDARFGSARACGAAVGLVVVAACLCVLGAFDLRPLLLLQLLPVLLIPASALSLPGTHTAKTDWLLMLGLYATARGGEIGDEAVLRLTGQALSGHALMHLCLAAVAAWLAYRAAAAPSVAEAASGLTQASISLRTSG